MQSNIFPWQQAVWQQFKGMRSRLPHALLLYGCTGIGKYQFARALSQSLLCATPTADGHACGACQSCHWFQENAHPDFRLLTPEIEGELDSDTETTKKKSKKKTNIAISQVRDLNDFMHLSGHQAHGYRVVLVHPAETLNLASANALLKMLEEPTENVIFILVAHQIHQLLPTILSRCQKIAMPMPDATTAQIGCMLKDWRMLRYGWLIMPMRQYYWQNNKHRKKICKKFGKHSLKGRNLNRQVLLLNSLLRKWSLA